MSPFDPRPAMVQTEDAQSRCIALYKLSLKGDEAEAKTALDNLGTWYEFAWELRKVRKETPYGEWGQFLERAGISPRAASEAVRMVENMSKPAVMALGSKTKVKEHLREHFPDENDADEGDTKSAGGADLPKTGEGPSRGARNRKGTRSGGTGPSPKSQQQSLPMDNEEAKERLNKSAAQKFRDLLSDLDALHESLSLLLRLEADPVEEFRKNARDSGLQLVREEKEPAAGFEDRAAEPSVVERLQQLDVVSRVIQRSVTGGSEDVSERQ